MTRKVLGNLTNTEANELKDSHHKRTLSGGQPDAKGLGTVIDLTEDDPGQQRTKRRRSSAGEDANKTCSSRSRQKRRRRYACRSRRAGSENQPCSDLASTHAPAQKPKGFVFTAGESSALNCKQSGWNDVHDLEPARWDGRDSEDEEPGNASSLEDTVVDNPVDERSLGTQQYPSWCSLERQVHTVAGNNLSSGSSRAFAQQVLTDVDRCRSSTVSNPFSTENRGPVSVPCQSSLVADQGAEPCTQGTHGSVAEDHLQSVPIWCGSSLQQSSGPAASSLEAASSFLNVPPDALNLWNIAKGAANEESEDLSRYTGEERRSKEDALYTRLNEPATRLTKSILNLRRRIRSAQQSKRSGIEGLERQLAQQEARKKKIVEEAAARMFLAQNRSRRAFSRIDLHRLPAPAAVRFLTMSLQKAAESLEGCPASGRHLLMVITGWGKHSKGGVGTLKHVVINQLQMACVKQRFNCDWKTVNKGAVLVALNPRGTQAEPPSARDVTDAQVLATP